MLVTFIVMMMDDDGAVMMILIVVMMDLDDAVMVLVLLVMMHDDHVAMMIPVPIPIVVAADADGDAPLLRKHHRSVVRCGRGQRRHAQNCERARDKNQLLHLIFLHCPGVKRGLCIWLREEQRQTAAACSSTFAKND
jgi:hypothetical protein